MSSGDEFAKHVFEDHKDLLQELYMEMQGATDIEFLAAFEKRFLHAEGSATVMYQK